MSVRSVCVNSVAVLIALLACYGGRTRGDDIAWSTDIEASLQRAAASGQPVLLEFTAPWCVYCKRMEKTTFVDAKVVNCINQRFVAVRVDADQNKELVADLAIKGLPAMLVVSPDLKIIERIPGFQTPEALLAKLDRVPLGTPPLQNPSAVASPPAMAPRQSQEELASEPVDLPTQKPDSKIRPVSRPAMKPPEAILPHEMPEESIADETMTADETVAADVSDKPVDEDFFASINEDSSRSEQRSVDKSAGHAKLSHKSAVSGAAFNGTCIVNAIENREIVAGSTEHTLLYKGQQLLFSSEENKLKFEAHPSAYWPMLDGLCPITLLIDEKEVHGDLQFAAFFRKRLWVFTTEQNFRQFLDEPTEIADEVEELMQNRAAK